MPVKVRCSFPPQRSFLPLTFNVGMVRGPLEGGYGSVRFIGSETQISQRGKSNFLRTNTIGIEMWNTICLIPTNKYIFDNQTSETSYSIMLINMDIKRGGTKPTKNIARVRNCPDITISNTLFGLCLFIYSYFCLFDFLRF